MTTIDSFLETPAGTVAVLSKDGQGQAVIISKNFGREVLFSVSDYISKDMDVVQQYKVEENARLELLGENPRVISTSEERDRLQATDGGYSEWYDGITGWLKEQPEGTVIFEGRSDTESADFSVGIKLSNGTWNSTGCDFYSADEIDEAFEYAGISAVDFDFEILPDRIK